MSMELLAAFFGALAISSAVGAFIVPLLRRAKAGQTIRMDGPVWHNKKQGTPTMGGLIFIAGITIVSIAVSAREIMAGTLTHVYVLLLSLVYAAIGFFDDYEKLRKKQNLGLTALQKFILQLVAAFGYLLLLRKSGAMTTGVYVPFANVTLSVPAPIYYIFAVFVMVGTVNAVNITDGIDGLATGVSIPVAFFFTAVSFIWGYTALGVFAASLAGGLTAFLFFNFHPAKVFMGDTGSLFLGGAICATAFALDMPLVLVPLGIVYLVEILSDVIQITCFKLTHGKRIFKMAPIHHHFEMCGWSEKKLFAVFTAVSLLFAVISYLGVYARY